MAKNNPRITLFPSRPSSVVLLVEDVSSLAFKTVPILINITPKMQKTQAIDFVRLAGITDQYTPNKYTNPHWDCCIATDILTGI